MKSLRIVLMIFILGGFAVLSLSCTSEPDSTPENQVVTVGRGNLTIDITAAGNLALSLTEDLTFDLFYQEGTIEDILVDEGDTVEEGQVLASLDIEEWDGHLSTLEDKVTAAKRQLTTEERDLLQAQINLQTAEQNLKSAQDDKELKIGTKELALLNKQISLEQAQNELNTGIAATDYDGIKAELNRAKAWYAFVEDKLQEAVDDSDTWLLAQDRAKERLETAQADYDNAISGYGTEEVAIKKRQVESAEMAVVEAQRDLDLYDVDDDIALKELSLELAQYRLEDAQIAEGDALEALVDAHVELDEAKSRNPVITAPFDGFIISVNVDGGDEILKGTVAVQLADPAEFEAEVMVSEMDILQVKVGGAASVQVDAMPGVSLSAKVTHISPTATIQSGVVNYEVKIELESLKPVRLKQREAGPGISPGQFPERLQQAIEEGRITREQAEEMIRQRRQGQGGAPPPGVMPRGGQPGPGQRPPSASGGQTPPSQIPSDFQLREGLTVTVSIIVDERNDVLLVPNGAITTQGGQSYVQVPLSDGTIGERAITTGINDWQYTEVTEGLNEGEEVVIPEATTNTAPTTPARGGGLQLFGRGRPPPPR